MTLSCIYATVELSSRRLISSWLFWYFTVRLTTFGMERNSVRTVYAYYRLFGDLLPLIKWSFSFYSDIVSLKILARISPC